MEKLHNFTKQQLDAVHNILFGHQKQASVINSSVTILLSNYICNNCGISALDSEDTVITSLKKHLEGLCSGNFPKEDETFLLLIVGEKSLENLKSVGPKRVIVNQPNPESPKCTFRVAMLGEDELDTTYGNQSNFQMSSNNSSFTTTPSEQVSTTNTQDVTYSNNVDDYVTRAQKIKDAILPLCPVSVKTAIPDNEYAQALCMAEYYYKNLDSAPAVKETPKQKQQEPEVPEGTKEKVFSMFLNNCSLKDIMNVTGLALDIIKHILNERGAKIN